MGCTLVIDTSFGSTVGIVGREPIVETDSRTHVEKLQVNIARAVEEAGLTPADIEEIVVGIGPAPFTGLRAGIVAAKALAFATGAKLVGQNVLDPQGEMMSFVLGDSAMFDGIDFLADVPRLSSRQSDGDVPDAEAKEHELDRHVTLCVNDARRKQLYFSLNHGSISLPDEDAAERRWIEMDIDYPEHIVERVNAALAEHGERDGVSYVVDVAGQARPNTRPSGRDCVRWLRGGRIGIGCRESRARRLCDHRVELRTARRPGRADRTVVPAPAGRRSAEPAEARARPCRCR